MIEPLHFLDMLSAGERNNSDNKQKVMHSSHESIKKIVELGNFIEQLNGQHNALHNRSIPITIKDLQERRNVKTKYDTFPYDSRGINLSYLNKEIEFVSAVYCVPAPEPAIEIDIEQDRMVLVRTTVDGTHGWYALDDFAQGSPIDFDYNHFISLLIRAFELEQYNPQ